MVLKKMCSCGKVIGYRETRCHDCSTAAKKDRATYNKKYDKSRPKHHSIYHTKRWKMIRKKVLYRDNYMCVSCLHTTGRIIQATTVHHITTLEDNKKKAYDDKNLISLCNSCHKITHDRYNKDKTSKANEMKRLYDAIQ